MPETAVVNEDVSVLVHAVVLEAREAKESVLVSKTLKSLTGLNEPIFSMFIGVIVRLLMPADMV